MGEHVNSTRRTYRRSVWTALAGFAGAVLLLVLGACGSEEPAPTPTPTAAPAATPISAASPTPDAAARFQAEWRALIAAAQEEGELVAALGGSATRAQRPIYMHFGEKFGITVVMAGGSGRAAADRLLAERDAGQFTVDILGIGPTTVNTRLIPAGAVADIRLLFIHPDVTDTSLWFGGQHHFSDPEQQYSFIYGAQVEPGLSLPRFNTDLVSQEDIDSIGSVFDYLDPRWKGRIVSLPPTVAGAGGTWFSAYIHPDIGPDWVRRYITEMDVNWSQDTRLIVDGIVRGKYAMGFAIGSAGRDIDALGELGMPVMHLTKRLKERDVLSGSGSSNVISVTTNPPHPNAQKLFINWFLSAEGQDYRVNNSEGDQDMSLRDDIAPGSRTTPEERRVEGRGYLFLEADPVLSAKRGEALEFAQELYRSVQ